LVTTVGVSMKHNHGKLCLTITHGEYIMIGDDVVIHMDKGKSNKQIKVLVIAPKDLKIRRSGYAGGDKIQDASNGKT